METKHPVLKDKPLEFFKRKKKREHEEQKHLLKATTSSEVSALRAWVLAANCIAKAKKPFATGEELILTAAKDICHEVLGEAVVQKVALWLPLSPITPRWDYLVAGKQAQGSHWYCIMVSCVIISLYITMQ